MHNAYEDQSTGNQFLAGASGTAATFAAFQVAYGLDVNGRAGPMLLHDAPAGDLRLLAGSVAIDGGTPISAVPTDIDGQPRPFGVAPDAGADEAGLNPYGAGCPGANGVPSLGSSALPAVGNPAFHLRVGNAANNALCLLFASFTAQVPGVPVGGGCLLHLDPTSLVTATAVIGNGVGVAMFPIPLPNNPRLRGLEAFFQVGIVDPSTVFGATATNAAHVYIQ